MMKIQRGGDATLPGTHKLFVEGSDDEQIDPVVLGELLTENDLTLVEVRAMDACDNVRSAAQALARHHPSYYFLIDRDDQDNAAVDSSWSNFPDPATHNLLIWRKRELESYFIDPDYIGKSEFLKSGITVDQLADKIRAECSRRVFLDAANLALMHLKRQIGRPFAKHFKRVEQFATREDGAHQLDQLSALDEKKKSVLVLLARDEIRTVYEDFIFDLSGGVTPLQYGSGAWLERISGKEVFHCIAGTCFSVHTANGIVLQGKEQNKEIAKKLLKLPLCDQPADFQTIVSLLKARIGSGFFSSKDSGRLE